MPEDRYSRGLKLMEAVQGPEAGERIRASVGQVSPDFARYMVEAGFADVYAREGLTLVQRELLNVGVLCAIGGAEPQLAAHVRGALHVGVSPEEIVEAIFHVCLYAGHPRTLNGLRVAKEVFDEHGIATPLGRSDDDPKEG